MLLQASPPSFRDRCRLRLQYRPLARNSVAAKAASGVGWNWLGNAVAQGCSFLTTVLLARVLGREGFGQFAMIQSTIISIGALASLGLGATSTKYVSEFHESHPERAGRIIGLSAITALAAALFASAGLFFFADHLPLGPVARASAAVIRCGSAYVFFLVVSAFQLGALAGFGSFRRLSMINIGYGVCTFVASWPFAVLFGIAGAVAVQCGGAALFCFLLHRDLARECASRHIVVHYRGVWSEHSLFAKFSAPAAACGIVGALAMWCANAILVRSAGYGEMAILAAVMTMRSLILFIPTTVARVTTPLLNQLKAGRQSRAFRKAFWTSATMSSAAAWTIALVVAIMGRRILALFGRSFTGPHSLVITMLAAVVVEVIAMNLYQALFASGQLWIHLAILCAWAVILVSLSAWFAPTAGAQGLATAYLVAWTFAVVLYFAAAWQVCERQKDNEA